MRYIRDHWQGHHPLVWSFAINLVLLRLFVFYLDRFTPPDVLKHPQAVFVATVLFIIVGHLIIYPWQIVGVLRACDQYLRELGSIAWVWAIYIGILISMVFTVISVFGTFQRLLIEPPGELAAERLERERASKYALTLTNGDTLINLSGSIELGVTKKLEALLEQNSGVTGIVLESIGGNIFEGRGIARLLQRYGLDAYVFDACYSACTTAFIGGSTRILGENGRLGFHQYVLEANYPFPYVDVESEQDRDRGFFRNQGIAGSFLGRVFAAPPSDLWFPSRQELLDAGVIHRIEAQPK